MAYFSEIEKTDEILNCDDLLTDLEEKRLLKNKNKINKYKQPI